jgi:hypothetical protein
MTEPIFMRLGMCIMTTQPISTAYSMNPSHQPVCLFVYALSLIDKRLGKNVTAATNTHATTEESLKAPFYMRPVFYQGE